jgi:regulator of RNase E activity RraA
LATNIEEKGIDNLNNQSFAGTATSSAHFSAGGVLTLKMTYARVIGRLGDGMVLVARAEQTTRDAMIAANQRLAEDRIRVLGTVLNDWNPRRPSSNDYYQYPTYSSSYLKTSK